MKAIHIMFFNYWLSWWIHRCDDSSKITINANEMKIFTMKTATIFLFLLFHTMCSKSCTNYLFKRFFAHLFYVPINRFVLYFRHPWHKWTNYCLIIIMVFVRSLKLLHHHQCILSSAELNVVMVMMPRWYTTCKNVIIVKSKINIFRANDNEMIKFLFVLFHFVIVPYLLVNLLMSKAM